jgi:hypothetical protein
MRLERLTTLVARLDLWLFARLMGLFGRGAAPRF